MQKVGYSTLAVSIPKRFAKEMNLSEGDSVLFREDADGTLRLIRRRRLRSPARPR